MAPHVDEERMQILKMLQEGRITAEQASELLAALEEPAAPAEPSRPQGQARFFRVMVREGDDTKVNVNIPLGLVRALAHLVPKDALKVGEGGSAQTIDLEAIIRAVEEGADGRIVEIHDEDTRVEIVVD
ncbi:SHOCT-like domain-containing protein [Limnochorda pilosa]|uniref:YvlB/LiaX N-terminal domain-containing protein n=1 Tax=Limnochorda pilosa TaxID=1555112 RepID=A0A0K2SH88_LIMPI|nr:hypothetical protein [Limnochorda pilosa]BAS26486.1 hypothetical protein LIP_0629 [Limnochorda pilosa]